MAISAKLVKELREKTGSGMMDCKKALEACDGDLEKAFDWLREKGIAKAAKKAERIAAEGLASVVVNGNTATIVEVNSETDFVAKNQEFKDLVKTIAELVNTNKPATLEAALAIETEGKTLETVIAEATAKIGEKISLRRFEVVEKTDAQAFGSYSHMGGKICALTLVDGASEEVARDVAMHLAAQAPKYIDRTAIPADVLDREKNVLMAQALEENAKAAKPKPENIVAKMVEGRLNKNLKEMCLVDQEFVKNPDITVQQYLNGGKVVTMIRYQVGEGMEKRNDNFAEEVAAQMRG